MLVLCVYGKCSDALRVAALEGRSAYGLPKTLLVAMFWDWEGERAGLGGGGAKPVLPPRGYLWPYALELKSSFMECRELPCSVQSYLIVVWDRWVHVGGSLMCAFSKATGSFAVRNVVMFEGKGRRVEGTFGFWEQ